MNARTARPVDLRRIIAIAVAIVLSGIAVQGYRNARADPVVRKVTLQMPRWPAGAPQVDVAVIGDLHLGSAVMDAARLRRMVMLVNALRPDLIVITGDVIAGHGPEQARRHAPDLSAALTRLRAPLGVVAVLGNHDHGTDPALLVRTLRGIGVTVLVNEAVRRGPLAIGGLDDPATGRERNSRVVDALGKLPGARVIVAHTPKPIWRLPKDGMLLLAGHTHCGQIVLPILWDLAAKEPDFRCGIIQDRRRTTVVTAGLGTSQLPLRFGAPPDLWLLTLGPKAVKRRVLRPGSEQPRKDAATHTE